MRFIMYETFLMFVIAVIDMILIMVLSSYIRRKFSSSHELRMKHFKKWDNIILTIVISLFIVGTVIGATYFEVI